MEKFKSFLVASNLAANTVSAYITAIKNYNEKYEDISKRNLLEWKVFLIENFKAKTVNLKIQAMNKYLEFIKPFVKDLLANESDERILAIANMFKGEITCGKDIVSLLSPIINASEVPTELEEFYNSETSKNVIKTFAKYLANIDEINKDTIKECFKSVQNELGVKGKDLYMPVRLKLTGVEHGLEMYNIITILGKENTLARLA